MIPRIKKILFTTDLSDSARYSFRFAADIAAHYGAGIVAMHVIDDIPHNIEATISGLLGEEKWKELQEKNEQDVRNILIGKKTEKRLIEQALEIFFGKFQNAFPEGTGQFEIIVEKGNVVEKIIEHSEKNECDLIVMTYHSRNMLAETIIGGVTRKVLKRSKKPVLLVPVTE